MRKVRILNGEYGGKVVTDTVFPLCKGWKLGKRYLGVKLEFHDQNCQN